MSLEQTNRLSRNTIFNMRKLLRLKNDPVAIDLWLKFILTTKQHSEEIFIKTKKNSKDPEFDIDQPSLENIVKESKKRYISLVLKGGSCNSIVDIFTRMKDIDDDWFFYSISVSPDTKDNGRGFPIDDVVQFIFDNRCFKTNIDLTKYHHQKYNASETYSAFADTLEQNESSPELFPDSVKIKFNDNVWLNSDWADEEHVNYLEYNVVDMGLLFDFPGVSTQTYELKNESNKIDRLEKMTVDDVKTFHHLFDVTIGVFNKADPNRVKFLDEISVQVGRVKCLD